MIFKHCHQIIYCGVLVKEQTGAPFPFDRWFMKTFNKGLWIMIILNSIVYAAYIATLQEVWNAAVQKWISPIVIMVMGALSLKFLLNRQWSQFINFLSIGIGVAVVVYIAPEMFNENSALMNSASDTAKMIN